MRGVCKTISYLLFGLILTAFMATDVMAQQLARPDSTIQAGNFTVTGAATHHEAVNEGAASDAEFITAASKSNSTPVYLGLPALVDPNSSTLHSMNFRLYIGA